MEAFRVCGIRIVTQVRQDLLIASQVNEETSHESLTTNPVSRFIWTDRSRATFIDVPAPRALPFIIFFSHLFLLSISFSHLHLLLNTPWTIKAPERATVREKSVVTYEIRGYSEKKRAILSIHIHVIEVCYYFALLTAWDSRNFAFRFIHLIERISYLDKYIRFVNIWRYRFLVRFLNNIIFRNICAKLYMQTLKVSRNYMQYHRFWLFVFTLSRNM